MSETPLEEWDRHELVERVKELEESNAWLRAEVARLTADRTLACAAIVRISRQRDAALEETVLPSLTGVSRPDPRAARIIELEAEVARLTARVGALEGALRRFYLASRAVLGIPGYRWSRDQIDGTRAYLEEAASEALPLLKKGAALGPAGAPPEEASGV